MADVCNMLCVQWLMYPSCLQSNRKSYRILWLKVEVIGDTSCVHSLMYTSVEILKEEDLRFEERPIRICFHGKADKAMYT